MAEAPSRLALVVLIVIVLVAAGAASAFVYFYERPKSPPSLVLVVEGDNVTVNYIGYFGSGPQAGRVFDTSIYSVAVNNAAYPKSLDYAPRGSLPSNFTPLGVHVGPTAPPSGYSVNGTSFVRVVTGFWQGLIGVPVNQTRVFVVPPALGYGNPNPACLLTLPLQYTLPVFSTWSPQGFAKAYPGAQNTTGNEFADPHFGWNVLILSSNATAVATENLTAPGHAANPSGWTVVVTNVTSGLGNVGRITLVNQLAPSQAGLILGKDYAGSGPCTTSANGKFIVTAVNETAGTYTESFNPEVQGQTLDFQVTVVQIVTAAPVV